MKPLCWCLAVAALAGSGCAPWFVLPNTPPPPAKVDSPAAAAPVRRLPPVTAEQINEANAHAQCDALGEELDREAQGPCPSCQDGPACACKHK